MKLWICDSRAEERWRAWLAQLPSAWEASLHSAPPSDQQGESPTLLLIHDGDGWAWVVPNQHPLSQVIRYTGAPRGLETHGPTGQIFCGLDVLKDNLAQTLASWPPASPGIDWLWDMLGGDIVLELSLELLHRLLPPALVESSPQGEHAEVWQSLTDYVRGLGGTPSSQTVEREFGAVKSLYEGCLTVDADYVDRLKKLRDALLGTDATQGFADVARKARRAFGDGGL